MGFSINFGLGCIESVRTRFNARFWISFSAFLFFFCGILGFLLGGLFDGIFVFFPAEYFTMVWIFDSARGSLNHVQGCHVVRVEVKSERERIRGLECKKNAYNERVTVVVSERKKCERFVFFEFFLN